MTWRFSANLSWLFQEWEFLDRFAAAADAGFTAVECLFPYAHDADAIAGRLADHKLELVLFNAPPGDAEKGERGLAALPERRTEFRAGIETALRYARILGVPRLHVMAGIARGEAAWASYREALALACDMAGPDMTVLIEPLNPYDVPGYLLQDFNAAAKLIADLDRPNLKLQFDIYHRQILHGDVTRGLEQLLPITGHIQIASVPLRHEPMTGELNDAAVFDALTRLGYDGFVGCEYGPAAGTREGLHWMAAYNGGSGSTLSSRK